MEDEIKNEDMTMEDEIKKKEDMTMEDETKKKEDLTDTSTHWNFRYEIKLKKEDMHTHWNFRGEIKKKKEDMTTYWNYRKECNEIVFNWKCSNYVGDDAVEQFHTSIERCNSLVLLHKNCDSTYEELRNKHKVDLRNEIDIWKRLLDLLRPEKEKAIKAFDHRVAIYDKTIEEILKIRDLENLVESDGFVGSEIEMEAFGEVKDKILIELSYIQSQKELQLKRYDDIINFVKRHNLESVLEKDEVIPEDVICLVLGSDPPPPKDEIPKENYKELMFKLVKLYGDQIQLCRISSYVSYLVGDIDWLIKRFDMYRPTENKREREDDGSSTSGLKNWKGSYFLNEVQ